MLLGLMVRQRRIERGWSVRGLAERVGVTEPTLAKVERGDPSVRLGVALEAAVIVGVPLFVEDPSRLAPELARQQELIRLLPARVNSRAGDVDDDF